VIPFLFLKTAASSLLPLLSANFEYHTQEWVPSIYSFHSVE